MTDLTLSYPRLSACRHFEFVKESAMEDNSILPDESNGNVLEKRVLIIDDEPLIARAISILLARNGFRNVSHETDARNAVCAVKNLQADVVLLDIHMPHLSGLQVLEQMNNEAALEEVVVLMHSSAGESEQFISFELGAAGFISKPASEHDLINAVYSVLQCSSPGSTISTKF